MQANDSFSTSFFSEWKSVIDSTLMNSLNESRATVPESLVSDKNRLTNCYRDCSGHNKITYACQLTQHKIDIKRCFKVLHLITELMSTWHTPKKKLSLRTKINSFEPCLKIDWSRLVNRLARNISHLTAIGSRPTAGESYWQIFRGIKIYAQRLIRTGDHQIFGLKLVPLYHSGLCK